MARIRSVTVVVVALAALVLAACGGEPDDPAAETEPPAPDDQPEDEVNEEPEKVDEEPQEDDVADPPERLEPEPGDPSDPGDRDERDGDGGGDERDGDAGGDGRGVAAGLDEEIEVAVDDLARRVDVAADAVTVVRAEHVTWRDGAIGCPDPDQMYTMALVEGYRIVLEADGERFDYHGQDGSEPFYCPDPGDPADDGQGRVTR